MIEELGRYKILDEIGQGGFAIVYRAHDSELDRVVALKELRPTLLHDAEWIKRFKREAQTIARLDHPRIVTIFDVVEEAGRLFIAMRLVDGPSLDKLIATEGPMPWSQALEIMTAMTDALSYAHPQGILHRDLKPANILLDSMRGALLSDFGMAKLVSEATTNVTAEGGIVGTPHYIAPEVWEGGGTTPQSDIYALGCILYEMLTGEKLFAGDSPPAVMMAHFSLPNIPDTWPEDVPFGLSEILTTALENQPNDRYASVGDMAAALNRLNQDTQARPRVEATSQEKIQNPPSTEIQNRHNLPTQPTTFVGREADLAALGELIGKPDTRLITILGPGGMGKTRLSIQVATEALETFADGVYFVPLAPISSDEFLIATIAESLGVSFHGTQRPQIQLFSYLQQKAMLLVLDNFEHVLDGADLLSEMMLAAPEVKLLVTSRERLNLQEEWVYELEGMEFPATDIAAEDFAKRASAVSEKRGYSALQLFEQRAQQAQADFDLTGEYAAVARICQLVNGMPLGLELAASWVKLMSPEEIVEEIEQSLDFLATSMRNVPERHRSLRAVFRYSWQLLSTKEQDVFKKLSVFRGGFLREAGKEVAGASLPLLSALVDKSLLRRTDTGRYEIHELLRQFAAEELEAASGASDQVQDQHSEYYLTYLEQQVDNLKGGRRKEALAEVKADIDNVRVGWQRAVAQKNITGLGKAANGLLDVSVLLGWFQEAEVAFRQAVQSLTEEQSGPVSEAPEQEKLNEQKTQSEVPNLKADLRGDERAEIVLAQLLKGQGFFSANLGFIELGQNLLQQSVLLLRQIEGGLQPELAHSLESLAFTYWLQGQYSETKRHTQESLALFTKIGDRWGMGQAALSLGWVATYQGEYTEANQFLGESLSLFKQVDNPRQADVLNFLAIVARSQGEHKEAERFLTEGLEIGSYSPFTLREMGYLAIAQGNYTEAKTHFQESLAIFQAAGGRTASVFPLDGLGTVARLRSEYQQAEQLHQESLNICREINEGRGIALCLHNLGRLAYDTREYSKAEQYQQESLTRFREIGHRHGEASALCHLGYAVGALGSDRVEEAGQWFHQALEIASKIGAAPLILDTLVGLITLLTANKPGEAEQERAVELLALVLHHSASEQETKDKAERIFGELKAELPSITVATAQERGKVRTLEDVANEILGEA